MSHVKNMKITEENWTDGMPSIRPRSFLETVFRPLYPSFGWFVPLSRTKRVFWISTRKPNIDWSGVDTSWRVRHPRYSMKLFVRSVFKKNSAWPVVCQTEGLAKMMCESYQTYENNRGKQNRWHAMSKVTPVKIEVNTKQMAYHLFFFQKISLLDL